MKVILNKLYNEPVFAAAVLSVAAVEFVPEPWGLAIAAVFVAVTRNLVSPVRDRA
jgi:predicted branched-subunit amino acid permease